MYLIELRHTSADIDGIVGTHTGEPRLFTLHEALDMIAGWAPGFRARTRVVWTGPKLVR